MTICTHLMCGDGLMESKSADRRSRSSTLIRVLRAACSVINSAALAAWSQTLVSLFALYFAFVSVESWREQELAKRQAEIASTLIIKVSSLHSVFTAMWPEPQRYTEADLTKEASILKAVYTQPAYFQFLGQGKELKLYAGVVSGTIPDGFLQLRIAELVGDLEAVATCVQHLRTLDREPIENKSGTIWKARAMNALAVFSLLPEQKSIPQNQNACNFEFLDVLNQMEQIQKLASRYLTLSPQARAKAAAAAT